MTSLQASLDSVLVQLGDFGTYQKYVFGVYCFAVILHSAAHVQFVFAARDLSYRCLVPNCDSPTETVFKPQWLRNAIPFHDNIRPEKCEMFKYLNLSDSCSYEDFDRTRTELCEGFVYETDERTILQDFNLHCEENLWKLTLIGTINNFGQLVGMPIAGVVSDKFGRRTFLVVGMLFCSLAGIARSFATSYITYVILEFLDAAFGAGTFICGFILGVELVGPKSRVLLGTILTSCYAFGELYVALFAWLLRSWRPLILVVYVPPVLVFTYFWIAPESVRWLLTQDKKEQAVETLKKAARVNKAQISEESLKQLLQCRADTAEGHYPIGKLFKSRKLSLRFALAAYCWVSCAFLFYGMVINSVALNGDPYLDFSLTALVEFPACILGYFILNKVNRRESLSAALILTSIVCFALIFIHEGSRTLKLCVYLLGKFGATLSFIILYMITSEVFPTYLRHSIMGLCSTFGRIGSTIAPQTPLLAQIWTPLPIVLFSVLGVIAGLATLVFPETYNKKLPDTIEEAKEI